MYIVIHWGHFSFAESCLLLRISLQPVDGPFKIKAPELFKEFDNGFLKIHLNFWNKNQATVHIRAYGWSVFAYK